MIILGLIGMPGAGKGECARIASEAGATVINMGDLVREHTAGLGLEMTDENVGGVAQAERERFGFGIWAKRTVAKIKKLDISGNDLVLIDGIRGDAEVNVFREGFGDGFLSIGIQIPAEDRYKFLRNRSRADAPMTRDEFNVRDERERKWGIERALADTDFMLMNTGSLLDLERSFRELLEMVQK